MGLLVIDPGLWTSVQDAGRVGFREWGVPTGGAFDRESAALANALLGNDPSAAVLELTLRGGSYEARSPIGIALAGAPMEARIQDAAGRDRSVRVPSSTTLRPGDRLVLGRTLEGARTYLAARGGFRTAHRMGSRSKERPLRQHDFLDADASALPTRYLGDGAWEPPTTRPIRILDGPDRGMVEDPAILESLSFRVGSRSNRMGLHLESDSIRAQPSPDRLSSPVAPGAVQLAGGQCIVLGVAGGTMGGYPHVAQVITADLGRIGQLRPGDPIRFQRVTLGEARSLDRRRRREWRALLLRVAGMASDADGRD